MEKFFEQSEARVKETPPLDGAAVLPKREDSRETLDAAVRLAHETVTLFPDIESFSEYSETLIGMFESLVADADQHGFVCLPEMKRLNVRLPLLACRTYHEAYATNVMVQAFCTGNQSLRGAAKCSLSSLFEVMKLSLQEFLQQAENK